MLGPITRFFLRHLLIPLWLLITSPPLLLFIWLVQPHLQSGAGWLGVALALAWIFGSWWLGETTTRYMAEESDLFLPAVKHTLRDLRLRLAFLPVVGRWFEPADDQHEHETDD